MADITYIETDDGVVYLHLVTDAWTHEIIGWVVSDTLMAVNTMAALKMAIEHTGGVDLSGLIHHSDRGSQYCSNAYVDLLKSINASISMTEDYKPTDNAVAERVNGIINAGMVVSDEKTKELGGCQQHHTGYYQLLQQQASAHEQQHDYSCAKA